MSLGSLGWLFDAMPATLILVAVISIFVLTAMRNSFSRNRSDDLMQRAGNSVAALQCAHQVARRDYVSYEEYIAARRQIDDIVRSEQVDGVLDSAEKTLVHGGQHLEPHPDSESTKASRDVLAERRRQIKAEGWAPEHDDQHTNGDLSAAAAGYARAASFLLNDGERASQYTANDPPETWPHNWEFKPSDPRRMLVKAGALILAEIERIDRMADAGHGGS